MRKIIKIKTDKLFSNITAEVGKFAKEWGKSGIVNVFSKHTTFCIWCTEDETLHKTDVRFFLDKLAPMWKDPEGEHKNIKYLHFELCYYQAIEWAIENNINFVEGGAQGLHKIQRGYLPVQTNSLHYIRNNSFKNAVENFIFINVFFQKLNKKHNDI